MGSHMMDLAETLQSFGETTDDNRFGEDFMQAATSIQNAASSFSVRFLPSLAPWLSASSQLLTPPHRVECVRSIRISKPFPPS